MFKRKCGIQKEKKKGVATQLEPKKVLEPRTENRATSSEKCNVSLTSNTTQQHGAHGL